MSKSPEIKKPTRHESSPCKRELILEALNYMKSKDVAKKFNVSKSQVSFLKNNPDYFKNGKSSPRSGRPPKLSERDKRCLLRDIKNDPKIKVKDLPALLDNKVGRRTIYKWRREEDIQTGYNGKLIPLKKKVQKK